MKKSLLVLGLLFAVTQSNCGVFDDAMSFLKKSASSLFEKGKQFVSQNSDKILSKVKEQAGQLYEKGVGMAKEKAGELYEKGMTVAKEQAGQLYEKGMGMAKEKATALYEQGKAKAYDLLGQKQPGIETTSTPEMTSAPKMETPTVTAQTSSTGITMEQAATELIKTTNVEADRETKELVAQAQDIVTKTKGLTPTEQKIILQEAQNLANQNRDALIKQANESIAKKREALKSSIYAKYGKETPTAQ